MLVPNSFFPFLSLLSTVDGLILPNPNEQELGSSFRLFFRFFYWL